MFVNSFAQQDNVKKYQSVYKNTHHIFSTNNIVSKDFYLLYWLFAKW
jgi:hypothetical protein